MGSSRVKWLNGIMVKWFFKLFNHYTIQPFFLLLFCSSLTNAQDVVYLKNSSFEARPRYAAVPGGWRNCAFNNESPPDIHPVINGIFEVTQSPQEGRSYLGLVARSNGTVEGVGQQLEKSLKAGTCYAFSVQLCKSTKLMSGSRTSNGMVNFNESLVLRLWGGKSPCGQKSMLAVSPTVVNTDWKKYTFQFRPEEDLTYISFDVFYRDGTDSYNGNLLMDNASPFIPIDCETKELLVSPDDILPSKYDYEKLRIKDAYLDFRVVKDEAGLQDLLLDNCSKLSFETGKNSLSDDCFYGLYEIARNFNRYKNQKLVIGLAVTNKGNDKLRINRLKQFFKKVNFRKQQYKLETLPPDSSKGNWLCTEKEMWVKIMNG